MIDWTLCEWITGNDKRDDDSEMHHFDVLQSFFDSGDEDADDDVAEADHSAIDTDRLALSLIFSLEPQSRPVQT